MLGGFRRVGAGFVAPMKDSLTDKRNRSILTGRIAKKDHKTTAEEPG